MTNTLATRSGPGQVTGPAGALTGPAGQPNLPSGGPGGQPRLPPGGPGGGRPGPPLPRPILPRERGYLDKFVEFLVSEQSSFRIFNKYKYPEWNGCLHYRKLNIAKYS